MSDSQEAIKNAPQEPPPLEMDRTLSALQRELHSDIHKSQQQKSVLQEALPNRQKVVEEHLARAREFYKKKELSRAFAEWDKVCEHLENGDAFRKKVQALRESHDNLLKANREVLEIKSLMNQRSSPGATDRKFVQNAHEEVSGQVKNVYGYISQQLRVERTPKALSFWWPVLASLVLLAVGWAGLSLMQLRAQTDLKQRAAQVETSNRQELTALQSERDSLLKQLSDLRSEHEKTVDGLKQQNAGWRNAGREKIEELELQLNETQRKNEELTKRMDELVKENLSLTTN